MDAVQTVGFFDAKYHFGHVKASSVFWERIFPHEETEKVAAWHVIHDKIQILLVLKACE